MRLYNSTLRVKDSGAHSWSKLKTCTFSEQEKYKIDNELVERDRFAIRNYCEAILNEFGW